MIFQEFLPLKPCLFVFSATAKAKSRECQIAWGTKMTVLQGIKRPIMIYININDRGRGVGKMIYAEFDSECICSE